MEIDLGSEIQINVKYAGKEYVMREPTVGELDSFRSQGEQAGVDVLVGFLERLGMPRDVVMSMGMSKARQLVDGLIDMITKKK